MKKTNNLDEMQELKLLHIEHNMAWIAFYGLFAAMLVHLLIFGVEGIRYILGEWLVFMVICLYLLIDCLRNGIWDREYKPDDRKKNMLISLAFSAVFSTVMGVVVYRNTGKVVAALIVFALFLLVLTVSCLASLALTAKIYKQRLKKLEEAEDG